MYVWASCMLSVLVVPFISTVYFDRKLPYRDHPYREFKHFFFMGKMAVVGSVFGVVEMWVMHLITGVGEVWMLLVMVPAGNFTMSFVEVIRYSPYGLVNPLKFPEYFRYEKQHWKSRKRSK